MIKVHLILRIYYALKRKCTIKWEAAKMSRVYIRHHIAAQITFSSTTFFMHLMYCRVISSQWIKSRCSLSSKNKCIFQGFHAFFGSPVWENWHVERNMRFRIIIMSGCQACICFLASLTSFFPSVVGTRFKLYWKVSGNGFARCPALHLLVERVPFAL